MSIKHKLRVLLWNLGYDFSRFTARTHPLARRKQILKSYDVKIVLDVGANIGSFAAELREIGYANRIISFEPLSEALKSLAVNAAKDPLWDVCAYALGDVNEKKEINIAGNLYSSSLFDVLPAHLKSAPESRTIGKEMIEVKTLDSVLGDLCKLPCNIYMKIDTQGYEHKVLRGSENSLEHIDTVQMEMSLEPLYEGALLFTDMIGLMSERGYKLVAIEPGFSDPVSGRLLQFDGIFHRFRL